MSIRGRNPHVQVAQSSPFSPLIAGFQVHKNCNIAWAVKNAKWPKRSRSPLTLAFQNLCKFIANFNAQRCRSFLHRHFANAVNVPPNAAGEVILGAGVRGNEFVMKVVIRHSGPRHMANGNRCHRCIDI